MISRYVKEQKRYSREELKDMFEVSEEQLINIIKKLKEFNVLKAVKNEKKQMDMSELLDEDVEVVDEENMSIKHLYVFTFVGIIIVESLILKCYPKYITNEDSFLENKMCQIMRVLRKYDAKEQIIKLYNDGDNNKAFNLLAAMVYLINDYYENGLYTNEQQIVEVNGSGNIDWNRTINQTYPIIQGNTPYYMELHTRKRVIDDYNFFKKLHEIVLTECSKEIKKADLLNILDLNEIELSEDELCDLGDREYIIYRIQNERNIQFNTRKQELLSIIEAYISRKGSLYDIDNFSMFGTNSFNLVWEEVCAKILDNKLEQPIGTINALKKIDKSYNPESKLISIIEKPHWSGYNAGTMFTVDANDTLIPDLISIQIVDGMVEFDIFDAKYYVTRINEKGVKGQPGIESITKQYLYQLAYKEFIKKSNIDRVNNCFLMPSDEEQVDIQGNVRMDMMFMFELEDIKVRKIPATYAYHKYITGRNIKIKKLKLNEE